MKTIDYLKCGLSYQGVSDIQLQIDISSQPDLKKFRLHAFRGDECQLGQY